MKPIQFEQARSFIGALKKTSDTVRLRAFYPSGHQFKAGDAGRKGVPSRATVEQWQS